ncbi:hypothetical protein BB560_006215 [Smittium megazygosporum]|uniref:Mannose-P-dolichol utilization defect 1 protein homolog n=1 Tax=Smittium megazygosporum TaxID=133381 RepID=A0A2T9YD45_9FUNG|nr:hypothetical protein BB560_006215 [Smittium megazygosporum]
MFDLLRKPFVLLIGEKCTTVLIDDFDVFHAECLKYAMIKALGFGLVLGGSIVKVPQIYKIVKKRSSFGISLSSVVLECISNIVSFSYNFRNHNPFSTFGESLFIGIQNLLLISIINSQNKKNFVPALLALIALWCSLSSSLFVNGSMLSVLHIFSLPFMISSRITQIWTNYNLKTTGQLAAFTIFANFIGTFARVITILVEVKDFQLILVSVINAVVNGILAYQMILYWQPSKKTLNKNNYEFGKNAYFAGKYY